LDADSGHRLLFLLLAGLVLDKMIEVFPAIKNVKIFRASLWILGEYCSTSEEIQSVMTLIRQSLGEVSR